MLSDLIIACSRRSLPVLAVLGLFTSLLVVACEKVPLLAPTGSTITLTSSTNALPVNGAADIIGQVLEAAGTPPHSGTVITFTTTLGSVEPAEARTDVSGRVIVKFRAGTANGNATITAISGGASTGTNALKIAVGTAAVGKVFLNANPATVPNTGGSTTLIATILDINGNALVGAPVSFSTSTGTLSAALSMTGADGIATSVLTTNQQATVTASVGATGGTTPPPAGGGGGTTPTAPSGQASATATVGITATPTIAITPPSTPPSVGLPATFTFVVTVPATNGSAVREVRVNWGDGDTVSLGAVTGSQAASHVYGRQGSFTVTATVTDVNGVPNTASTVVSVIPVARPGITITQAPNPGKVNNVTNLTIQVTVPTGINVQSLSIDFGDNTSANLGGGTSAVVPHIYTAQNTYTVTVTVLDSANQTTIGTGVVAIIN